MAELMVVGKVLLMCSICLLFLLWYDEAFNNRPKEESKTGFKRDMLRVLKRAMLEGGIVVVLVALLIYPFVWVYRKLK